jgi:hypothetical protein
MLLYEVPCDEFCRSFADSGQGGGFHTPQKPTNFTILLTKKEAYFDIPWVAVAMRISPPRVHENYESPAVV